MTPALALLLLVSPAADELGLLPLASVHRPVPVEVEAGDVAPKLRGCPGPLLPAMRERLPFGPGEQIAYDITFLGVRTGRAHLKVGERALMDGVPTYPLHGQLKTDGFLSAFGDLDARMVSFFDPRTLAPVRMVNRVEVREPFAAAPTISHEDGAFAAAQLTPKGPRGGEINTRLRRFGPKGEYDRRGRFTSGAEVVDLVSVIYYLRAHQLPAGAAFCFELYHRRRLWRVSGTVGGVEVVSAPAGSRRARRLDAVLARAGKHAPPPRPVTAWISVDADHVPWLVRTPEGIGQIEARMRAITPGRRLVEK
ncbi:MAG: hypothetical protein A2138_16440 [Deltaproteobacteria bacterium RBG_16_71_12]|nr:MAG: hypothetical protein A2138_16440 [Deltaproteobacteria bacterium RBG_16_71_12]